MNISGEKISLYVASIKGNGLIERFRFGAFPVVISATDLRRERVLIADLLPQDELMMEIAAGDGAGGGMMPKSTPASEVIDLREDEEEAAVTPGGSG